MLERANELKRVTSLLKQAVFDCLKLGHIFVYDGIVETLDERLCGRFAMIGKFTNHY